MKRIHLLLLGFFALIIFACSEDDAVKTEAPNEPTVKSTFLTADEAAVVARQFLDGQKLLGPQTKAVNTKLEMVYTDLKDGIETKSGQQAAYYVFNIGETGYVIVSASKATLPVLGYSMESKFNPETIPSNMAAILVDFKNEINYSRTEGLQVDASIAQARKQYLDGTFVETKSTSTSVNPLLGRIKWNQSPYYNALCPKGTPVGCVATATSQIMRYWKYPAASTGTHSYRHSTYGTLSFDYNYTLDWDAMPASRLTGPNAEIAKFCYGVAVGVNMHFGPQGSGAYQSDVPELLRKHYKYPAGIRNVSRSRYNATDWASLIRKELSEGRPVQYAGHGNGGGHSFVCDGYSSNGYFHFNWGWGGMSDGYFLLNALNPGSLGTGGGAGGFNSWQQAVINFEPPGGGNGGDDNDDETSEYCDAKAANTYYTYIKGVTLANMSNVTGGSSKGYGDYTAKKIFVKPGARVYCKLTPGFLNYAYKMYWCGWIDLNNDGQFDDAKERFAKIADTRVISGTFGLPSNVPAGSYRVRIAMKYGSYPSACETFKYGEVEDYTLVIQ